MLVLVFFNLINLHQDYFECFHNHKEETEKKMSNSHFCSSLVSTLSSIKLLQKKQHRLLLLAILSFVVVFFITEISVTTNYYYYKEPEFVTPTILPPPTQPSLVNETPLPRIHIEQRPTWTPSNITTAIVMIMKNSEKYVADFVKYHIALGFDKFIIYENDQKSGAHEKALQDAQINPRYFKVIHFPGFHFAEPLQLLILNDFVRKVQQNRQQDKNYDENIFFKGITHHAHIDVDEYIVLKKHSNIKEFIADYFKRKCGAISIHHRHFGSCGKKRYSREPVPLRFVCWGEAIFPYETPTKKDLYVKSISETNLVKKPEIHVNLEFKQNLLEKNTSTGLLDLVDYISCNTNGNPVPISYDFDEPRDVAELNHYRAHSYEEFMILDRKGRAGVTAEWRKQRTVEESQLRFSLYDNNTFFDFTAYNFWKEKVERMDYSS